MKKVIPTLKSDQEAEELVASANLADYDLSGATMVHFELKPKDKTVNLRLPGQLLDAVRREAQRAGIPYQRFIRLTLEQAVHPKVS